MTKFQLEEVTFVWKFVFYLLAITSYGIKLKNSRVLRDQFHLFGLNPTSGKRSRYTYLCMLYTSPSMFRNFRNLRIEDLASSVSRNVLYRFFSRSSFSRNSYFYGHFLCIVTTRRPSFDIYISSLPWNFFLIAFPTNVRRLPHLEVRGKVNATR